MDKSEFGTISRCLMMATASEYYKKELKFDPLVDPSQLELKRVDRESQTEYNRRKREHENRPLIRNDALLRSELQKRFTHKDGKAHANALVHILQTVCKETDLTFFRRYLETTPKLVPTVQMLRRLGLIPDIKIREYNSLFHRSEWIVIQRSMVYKAEDRTKAILREKISIGNLPNILSELGQLSHQVKSDLVSSTILSMKKKRLAKAAIWKRSMARGTVQPLDEAKHRIHEEGIQTIFSPFEILAAEGLPRAGELFSFVRYDKNEKSWFSAIQGPEDLVSQALQALGEYIAWLNS
jgi:hypothetical protein